MLLVMFGSGGGGSENGPPDVGWVGCLGAQIPDSWKTRATTAPWAKDPNRPTLNECGSNIPTPSCFAPPGFLGPPVPCLPSVDWLQAAEAKSFLKATYQLPLNASQGVSQGHKLEWGRLRVGILSFDAILRGPPRTPQTP